MISTTKPVPSNPEITKKAANVFQQRTVGPMNYGYNELTKSNNSLTDRALGALHLVNGLVATTAATAIGCGVLYYGASALIVGAASVLPSVTRALTMSGGGQEGFEALNHSDDAILSNHSSARNLGTNIFSSIECWDREQSHAVMVRQCDDTHPQNDREWRSLWAIDEWKRRDTESKTGLRTDKCASTLSHDFSRFQGCLTGRFWDEATGACFKEIDWSSEVLQCYLRNDEYSSASGNTPSFPLVVLIVLLVAGNNG